MMPFSAYNLGSSWRGGLFSDLGSEALSSICPAMLEANQFKPLFPGFYLQPQQFFPGNLNLLVWSLISQRLLYMWSDTRGEGSRWKPKEVALLEDVLTDKWGEQPGTCGKSMDFRVRPGFKRLCVCGQII